MQSPKVEAGMIALEDLDMSTDEIYEILRRTEIMYQVTHFNEKKREERASLDQEQLDLEKQATIDDITGKTDFVFEE